MTARNPLRGFVLAAAIAVAFAAPTTAFAHDCDSNEEKDSESTELIQPGE